MNEGGNLLAVAIAQLTESQRQRVRRGQVGNNVCVVAGIFVQADYLVVALKFSGQACANISVGTRDYDQRF